MGVCKAFVLIKNSPQVGTLWGDARYKAYTVLSPDD